MPSRTHPPEPPVHTAVRTAPEVPFEPGALALRLAMVPDGAPPYDCDAHGAGCAAVGTIQTGTLGTGTLGTGTVRPGTGVDPPLAVPAPRPGTGAPAASPVAAGTTGAWPRQFAQVVIEILAGARPARQIFPWTTDRARAQLRRLGSLADCDRRPTIQRVVSSRPTAAVVEMTVVVNFGVRTRALAMRFEHVAGRQAAPGLPARPARWLCTEIEAG